MKCPYCNQDMEIGKLNGLAPGLFYLPFNSKAGGVYTKKSIMKKGGLVLSEILPFRFMSFNVLSYRCKKCRKIILPY